MSLSFDASIPVLTEVFQNPAEQDAAGTAEEAAPPSQQAAQQTASPAPGGFYPAAPATVAAPLAAPGPGQQHQQDHGQHDTGQSGNVGHASSPYHGGAPGSADFPAAAPVVAPLVPAAGPVAVPGPGPAGAYSAVAAAPALPVLSGHEWAQLERRLAEGVLLQLQGRIDVVLEQALRDSIAAVLRDAVAGLTSEIRAGLQTTVEHIVSRAVAQELADLRAHTE